MAFAHAPPKARSAAKPVMRKPRHAVQAKLDVGPAGGRYEQEADRTAAHVTTGLAYGGPAPSISPLTGSAGPPSQRHAQREEKRGIGGREEKPPETTEVFAPLQRKTKSSKTADEPKKAQRKTAPSKNPEEQKGAKAQRKAKAPEEKKKAQRRSITEKEKAEPRATAKAQRKAKADAKLTDEPRKAQRKPIAAKKNEERDTPKAQRKNAPAKSKPDNTKKTQRKTPAPAKSKPREEKLQTKARTGLIQRDDVADDTVEETTVLQTKRLQRETVKAESVLVPAVEEEKPKPAPPDLAQTASEGGGGGFTAPSSVESSIGSMRASGGTPLSQDTRSYMEPRFGRDFSSVRVHTGAAAGEAASALNAHAFTTGSDIFFAPGAYRPDTSGGRMLLAHELTHTVQQRGGSSRAQPASIQRANTGKAASKVSQEPKPSSESTEPPSKTFVDAKKGTIEAENKRIVLPVLKIPRIEGKIPKGAAGGVAPGKSAGTAPAIPTAEGQSFAYAGKTKRGSTTARQQWLANARANLSDKIKAAIPTKVPRIESSGVTNQDDQKPVGYLIPRGEQAKNASFIIVGTVAQLARADEVLIPIWNRKKDNTLFDVDHIHELQLGGLDGWENFWLLDQSANRSSGSNIAKAITDDFNELMKAATEAGFWTAERGGLKAPELSQIKSNASDWKIEFSTIGKLDISGTKSYWTKEAIAAGEQFEFLKAMTEDEIAQEGLAEPPGKKPSHVSVFAQKEGGGFRRRLNIRGEKPKFADDFDKTQFYKGFRLSSLEYTYDGSTPLKPRNTVGTVVGKPFASKTPEKDIIASQDVPLPIYWAPGLGFGGYIERGFIKERLGALTIVGASPIEIKEAGISQTGELYARGEIVATKALFPNLRIPIYLSGNDIFISFPIPTDKLNFGPVHVTEAALDLGVGEYGVFARGFANVKVDQVGSGRLEARVEKRRAIIDGDFNFDLDFLDPAKAHFKYDLYDDALTLSLTAGVKKGQLPGVESGQVTATFSRDGVGLDGTLALGGFLKGATATLTYTTEGGLVIGAQNIPLPVAKIPGVKDASVSVQAARSPETGEWKLSGMGSASFGVPAVNGSLMVAVNGTAVTITGMGQFERGPAAGFLTFTATNQAMDPEGKPIEGQPGDSFTVTGKGSASVKFGILTGTAIIEFTPDARVIVTGEIALPPTHEVFGKKSYKKELVHAEPPDFPIWGVSLGGYGIGIFAFVDAYLLFDAYVGPGTLQNTAVGVQFDIEHPEAAVLDGHAEFVVPAGAGFTLDIGGGLKAKVAIAELKGRVGLDARLGLEAEARAGVDVHWSQQEGLSLAAVAQAVARPRFDIGANASVTASIDLWVTELSHTWGPWRKQLGSFGPELEVGVKVPVKWAERTGLDFNTDNIEIKKPDIDFGQVMTDAFLSLV